MPFTVPDLADAGHADQARLFSRDVDMFTSATAYTAVQLGAYTDCAVTPSSLLTVAVAAGTVRVRGYRTAVAGGTTTLATANATNPRFDLVVATKQTGVLTSITGTAAASPAPPTYDQATYIVLAAVRIPANLTTVAAGHIVDKRMFGQDPGCEFVDWYGAVGTTDGSTPTVDSSAAWIAAEAALPANGGTVVGGAKRYGVNATVGPTKNDVRFTGAGRSATELVRLSNVTILDVLGAHPTTTTTVKRTGFAMDNMSLHSNNDTWTAPLARCMYTATAMFMLADFYGGGASQLDSTEFWDSYFYGCRFQGAGQAAGANPATLIRSSTGLTTGIGHSTDNTNNIWFFGCVWESNLGGNVSFLGRVGAGDGPVNKCNIVGAKLEQVVVGAPALIVEDCNTMNLGDLDVTCGATFKSGVVTSQDMVRVVDSNEVRVTLHGETTGNTTATVRTALFASGTADLSVGVTGSWQTTNKPTTGLVEFSGTNTRVDLRYYAHNWDPAGNTPLVVGWPTSLAASGNPDRRARSSDTTSTSTTITDAGSTTMFDVEVGTYLLEMTGLYRSSLTTAGPRFGVGGTATVTTVTGHVEMFSGVGTATPNVSIMSAANTGYGVNPDATGADRVVRMSCYATVTVRGTLGVRWLMSAASTGTFREGSSARLTRRG